MARELQDALHTPALFERWRATQDDPDEVDPALGATDPAATVEGRQDDLHIDLIVVTSISGAVFKQRLRLLAGSAWELRDVSSPDDLSHEPARDLDADAGGLPEFRLRLRGRA